MLVIYDSLHISGITGCQIQVNYTGWYNLLSFLLILVALKVLPSFLSQFINPWNCVRQTKFSPFQITAMYLPANWEETEVGALM